MTPPPPVITVVGSFAVGLTIRASKLPIFGQTILGSDFDMGPGGKGSNQAIGTARLEANSSLVAIIGQDKLAEIAIELYGQEGIDTRHLSRSEERATGVGFIILNEKGENLIILDMGANELMDPAYVDSAEALIAQSDIVMTVLEIPIPAAMRAMELGRKYGAKTILNPAPATPLPDEIFSFVDYLTPNESELRILLGLAPDDPRPSRELASKLRERGIGSVIVTLGEQGTLVLTDHHDLNVPGCKADVVDTTGAGDAFNSGFAVALGEQRGLIEAVQFGCACGALACTKLGVTPGLAYREAADEMFSSQY